MNTNEFRRHLASIHNVLNSNQRSLYEGKEEVEVEESTEIDTQELEEALVVSFLESYFGGELNEDTDDDDITNAIMELNATCLAVNEYFGVTEGVMGGVAGGALGSALGPVGTVAGAYLGHKIQQAGNKKKQPA
jgi:hypothetical protein